MQIVPALILRAIMWATFRSLCPDARLQTVLGVISESGHGFEIVIVERLYTHDRPEDLLANHAHITVGFRKHRRLDKIAIAVRRLPTRDDLRTVTSTGLYKARDTRYCSLETSGPRLTVGSRP